MNYTLENRAYKKLMLHIMKYSKSDCLGVLIGAKNDKNVKVEDAVPLFHNRLMSGMLEVAFEQIEANLPEGQKIVGVYEAPVLAPESTPSPIGASVASQIKQSGHFNEPCIFSIKVATVVDPVHRDRQSQKFETELHSMSSGGPTSTLLTKQTVSALDFRVIQPHIVDRSYLKICDFDDHFENVENDWLNSEFN